MFTIPLDLKYSKDHAYVRLEGDLATVGLTAPAVYGLGDPVVIMIDPLDRQKFKAGRAYGAIEGNRATIELQSPVTGTIQEINPEVIDHLDSLLQDPYGVGWIVKFRIDDPGELDNLMSAGEYAAYSQG